MSWTLRIQRITRGTNRLRVMEAFLEFPEDLHFLADTVEQAIKEAVVSLSEKRLREGQLLLQLTVVSQKWPLPLNGSNSPPRRRAAACRTTRLPETPGLPFSE
jgi:hypothetical protein